MMHLLHNTVILMWLSQIHQRWNAQRCNWTNHETPQSRFTVALTQRFSLNGRKYEANLSWICFKRITENVVLLKDNYLIWDCQFFWL
jgi:hypothetical protein